MQIIDATTPEQFQQLLAEHPRVLVDFHKDQCPGCRMLEMSLHRVANSVAGQGTTLLRRWVQAVCDLTLNHGLSLLRAPVSANDGATRHAPLHHPLSRCAARQAEHCDADW